MARARGRGGFPGPPGAAFRADSRGVGATSASFARSGRRCAGGGGGGGPGRGGKPSVVCAIGAIGIDSYLANSDPTAACGRRRARVDANWVPDWRTREAGRSAHNVACVGTAALNNHDDYWACAKDCGGNWDQIFQTFRQCEARSVRATWDGRSNCASPRAVDVPNVRFCGIKIRLVRFAGALWRCIKIGDGEGAAWNASRNSKIHDAFCVRARGPRQALVELGRARTCGAGNGPGTRGRKVG